MSLNRLVCDDSGEPWNSFRKERQGKASSSLRGYLLKVWGFLVTVSGAAPCTTGGWPHTHRVVCCCNNTWQRFLETVLFYYLVSTQLQLWQKSLMGLYQFPFACCLFFLYSGVWDVLEYQDLSPSLPWLQLLSRVWNQFQSLCVSSCCEVTELLTSSVVKQHLLTVPRKPILPYISPVSVLEARTGGTASASSHPPLPGLSTWAGSSWCLVSSLLWLRAEVNSEHQGSVSQSIWKSRCTWAWYHALFTGSAERLTQKF